MNGGGESVVGSTVGGAWLARLRRSVRPAQPLDPTSWLAGQLDIEARARTGFHAIPLGIMIGIAGLYAFWLDAPLPVLATALAAALLGCRLSLERPWLHGIAMLVAAMLAGAFLARAEIASTQTTMISGGATVRIEGRVEWREVDELKRSRYVVRIEGTRQPTLSRPPERARILVAARHEPIPVGGRFSGLVRLSPPSGPALPGAYDFAFAPFYAGTGAIGFALGAPDRATPIDPPGEDGLAFGERVAAMRLSMADHIAASIGGAEGAVAAALVTGVRAGIPPEVEEDLRVTGLAHVLSISGYHMALVAGFTMLGVRASLAAFPRVALNVPVKSIAAGAALLVSALYLFIAGDNVATDRSFIMLAIMLCAVILRRPALTLRNVSIAAIVVLVMQPHAMFTAGFQMSFAATAALVGIYGAVARHGRRVGESERPDRGILAKSLRLTGALLLTSIVAALATAPFGAYHFGRLAPYGIVANLLLTPLFSLWIMPGALLGVLLMPFGLDGLVWLAVGQGLSLVFQAASALATAFPDVGSGRIGLPALLFATAAILAASMLASRLRWIAAPLALASLVAVIARPPAMPELLVFEDGKQVALVGADGHLVHLRERPSRFVDEQWRRALGSPADPSRSGVETATEVAPSSAGETSSPAPFACVDAVCRGTTRSGIRVAWTEDYEKTGLLCETADIAIVARAILLDRCRSGAALATLRTLRRTGSLAVARLAPTELAGKPPQIQITSSVEPAAEPWNAHRLQPWPEYWRNPAKEEAAGARAETTTDAPRPVDMSDRRGVLVPAGEADTPRSLDATGKRQGLNSERSIDSNVAPTTASQ